MNNQLQQAMVEIINKTVNSMDSSVNFMEAQLPDVIKQVLMFHIINGVVFGLIGIICIVLPIVIIIKAAKKKKEGFWYKKYFGKLVLTRQGVATFATLSCIAVYGICTVGSLMTALQIWVAPKLWLMEYAANLVK